MSLWRTLVDERLGTIHQPTADKRTDLRQAIERHVRPGMRLNPVSLQARPVAALHELIRVFGGGDPGFEFISSSLSGNYLQLVGAGLGPGVGYPSPRAASTSRPSSRRRAARRAR